MKKVTSATPAPSENKVEADTSALDTALEQSLADVPENDAETETMVEMDASEETSSMPTETEDTEMSIFGYIELIDNLEIHGWVIDYDGSPLKLALRISDDIHQVSYTWLERTDIAEQFGYEFKQSGFRITIPQGLAEIFELAYQLGEPIHVIANGVTLPNKVLQTGEANSGKTGNQDSEESDTGTINVPNEETAAVDALQTMQPSNDESSLSATAESQPESEPTVIDGQDEASLTGEQTATENELSLSTPFLKENILQPITAQLFEKLSTVTKSQDEGQAESAVTGLQLNGLSLQQSNIEGNTDKAFVPSKLEPTMSVLGDIEVRNPLISSQIDVLSSKSSISENDTDKAALLSKSKPTIAIDGSDERNESKLTHPQLNTLSSKPAILGKDTDKADVLSKSEQISPVEEVEEPTIFGQLEHIETTHISGWVIDKGIAPIKLSLAIDETIYQVSSSWFSRLDIAKQFGDEFIQSGFEIEIPAGLIDDFLTAIEDGKTIDIIANNVVLESKVEKLDPVIKPKEIEATPEDTQKKPITINGYVEYIDNIYIYGWVIDMEKAPIELSLRIARKTAAVKPEWFDRLDISGGFGTDFLKSGFRILVPKELIDAFLEACKKGQRIDVIANGIMLASNFKKIKFDPYLLGPELASKPDKFQTIFDVNAEFNVEIDAEDFSKLIDGQIGYPVRISRNNSLNWQYYLKRAKQKLIDRDTHTARTLLKICLTFEHRAEALELLGNTYFEQKDYETAAYHYEEATTGEGNPSKWLVSNLMHCKKLIVHPRDVVEVLLGAIQRNPESHAFRERFDELIHEYWMKQQGLLEVLAVLDKRDELVNKMGDISAFIYGAYLNFYGATESPKFVGSGNLDRVLIVGDFHIQQCVRYRIEQKIEQLEKAGKTVTAVSWTDIANQQNALALHDIVIFYRVPAEPPVLKAMAQVNATGRLSIYEIDDLLFDTAYPPAIETYGGYLDLNIYIQLIKGMASFNAAAHYCRFGMASTRSLADKLRPLVFGGECFIHRNGIDSLNQFKHKIHDTDKDTVDIFYGSGTMAHNSDFTDLALPAITRLLDEYPHVNLKIAGYLKLPASFLDSYSDRVKQMPPVKSIKAYWSMLERADINLAVLHDDEINGSKSELKWFEAACLGIPSVVSSTANYRDIIHDGEDGFIAATIDDWYGHLKALVDDPSLRQSVADKAQARVCSEYSIAALADNISALLEHALSAAQEPERKPRKKIALVNVFFPPQSIGGATRVIADNFDLLQRDYQDQFDISVFTSDNDHKPPYQMTVYNYQGARVYRSTILWREHMDWHPIDETMGELFAEYLEAEQPDIVHFHCIQRLSASVVEATRRAKIPYVVTVHDAWWISDYQFLVDANNTVYPDGHPDPYLPYTLPNNISQLESIERILYLKGLLRSAQSVLTVSNCFANIYRKNEIPEIIVNKNGISETLDWQSKDTSHTDKVVCGHVGGMAEHKGYNLLKATIEALQPKHLEMLIVDHSQEEDYHLQTHWGKVPVTFIGRMAQNRVVDLYRQIDVLFAPSTWPESYGLVTREAAACGCWIVASNMGGIGEDVIDGESGFVIEPTEEALGECIQEIDRNPSIYKDVAHPPSLRRVSEQVAELSAIYAASV